MSNTPKKPPNVCNCACCESGCLTICQGLAAPQKWGLKVDFSALKDAFPDEVFSNGYSIARVTGEDPAIKWEQLPDIIEISRSFYSPKGCRLAIGAIVIKHGPPASFPSCNLTTSPIDFSTTLTHEPIYISAQQAGPFPNAQITVQLRTQSFVFYSFTTSPNQFCADHSFVPRADASPVSGQKIHTGMSLTFAPNCGDAATCVVTPCSVLSGSATMGRVLLQPLRITSSPGAFQSVLLSDVVEISGQYRGSFPVLAIAPDYSYVDLSGGPAAPFSPIQVLWSVGIRGGGFNTCNCNPDSKFRIDWEFDDPNSVSVYNCGYDLQPYIQPGGVSSGYIDYIIQPDGTIIEDPAGNNFSAYTSASTGGFFRDENYPPASCTPDPTQSNYDITGGFDWNTIYGQARYINLCPPGYPSPTSCPEIIGIAANIWRARGGSYNQMPCFQGWTPGVNAFIEAPILCSEIFEGISISPLPITMIFNSIPGCTDECIEEEPTFDYAGSGGSVSIQTGCS